jgi:predicted nucleic acid-binding protein
LNLGVVLVPDGDLLERAALLSINHRHPVYDCLDLAPAQRDDAQVVRADKRRLSVFGQGSAFKVIHLHDL